MTPAGLNHTDKLAGLDFRLFDRIHDEAVRSHDRFIIDLAAKQHISAGRIHVDARLQPFALEDRLAAAGNTRDDLALPERFFCPTRRYKLCFYARDPPPDGWCTA